MRVKNNKLVYAVLGILVLSFALSARDNASAQSAAGPDPEADDEAEDDTAGFTGAQQVAWIAEQQGVSRSIYQRVQNMLDRARKEKDTLKITCLDDKLTQIHVNMRGIEERKAALETAVSAKDTPGANQQFTILKIYVSRVQGLMAEAENCIGDTDVVIGESETVVTIDEDIVVDDPTTIEEVVVGVEQPPHASAFY